jgi:rRNA maturation endonuclease Nob1
MIWEAYQQTKIAGAERTADRAMSKADRYAADIADISRKVDRLSLACQAMWELLRDRSELTEDDIEAKILEIDSRDGRVDGKIATKLVDCATCGRPTNSRRCSCVMCGAPLKRDHQFEG